MELQWSFRVKLVAVLWIQHRRTDREYNFKGKLNAPGAILHHSGCPIIFRVHKHNEEELLCNLSFKNNASTGEKVRVVAGRAIDHVKHEFLGYDATRSLL